MELPESDKLIYRCPWCGKYAFSEMDKTRISVPSRPRYRKRYRFGRGRSLTTIDKSCNMCGAYVVSGPAENATSPFSKWMMYVVLVVVLILPILVIIGYITKSMTLCIISYFLLFLGIFLPFFLGKTGVIKRAYHDTSQREYNPELYEAKLTVSVDRPIKLNKETVYAFKLKGVMGEELATHLDHIMDYNKDGVTAIFRRAQGRLKYTLDVIHPEYYDGKFFKEGVEIDINDSTQDGYVKGRIEQLHFDNWPVAQKKRPPV